MKTISEKKFTLIELLTCIAVIAIIASLLLPSIGKARNRAKIVQCTQNIKDLTIATHMYADSNNGHAPAIWWVEYKFWFDLINPYTGVSNPTSQLNSSWRCPLSPNWKPGIQSRWWANITYGYQRTTLGSNRLTENKLLFTDTSVPASGGYYDQITFLSYVPQAAPNNYWVHGEFGINCGYTDGSVLQFKNPSFITTRDRKP